MKGLRRLLVLVVTAAALAGLAGCRSDTDQATVFVQGELDAAYKGECAREYFEIAESVTPETVQKQHQAAVDGEAEYLLAWLDVGWPNDEVSLRAREVAEALYANSRYTVGQAEKLKNGDMVAQVVVSPLEVFHLIDEDRYLEVWDQVLEGAGIETDEELEALSDGAYSDLESEYGLILLDEIEGLLPRLSYGADQTVLLQLHRGEDGVYSLSEEGLDRIYEVILDYFGDFLE